MNKRLALTTSLLLLCVGVCLSQNYVPPTSTSPSHHESPLSKGEVVLSKLRKEMTNIIQAMALPYRDYHFSYSIRYDTLSSQYRFSTRERTIQETLGERMDSLIQAFHLKKTNEDGYRPNYTGVIRFDSYTDGVFVRVEPILSTYGTKVDAQPRDGLEAFVKRWIAYLDSLQTTGEPILTPIDRQDDVWGIINVEPKGTLVVPNTASYHDLLEGFVKQEEKWHPRTLYGRVMRGERLKLRIAPVNNRSYSSWKKSYQIDKIAYIVDGKTIFVAEDLEDIPDNSHIVSAISYQNKYVAPVVHRGEKEKYTWLTELLHNLSPSEGLFRPSYERFSYERLYFYMD